MSEWCYRLTRRAARTVLAPWVSLQVWRLPGAVEEPGAALLIANHISHFDPVLLCVAFTRPIDWMTTEEFYANPIGAAWLRGLNTFPVDRSRPDRRALRLGMERLRAGRLVGVFPEGGIRAGPSSIIGGTAPKRGATALARLAKVPIIPSVIFGSDRLYAARSWSPLPPRVPVWIAVGPSFSVGDEDDPVANENLALGLRQLAAQAVAHFHLTSADLPASPQHRKGRDNLLPNE